VCVCVCASANACVCVHTWKYRCACVFLCVFIQIVCALPALPSCGQARVPEVCCIVLQCVAACCSVLQCVLQWLRECLRCVALCCSVLQHVAVCVAVAARVPDVW